MPRSNNYAVLGFDILLPLERVLKYPPLLLGESATVKYYNYHAGGKLRLLR